MLSFAQPGILGLLILLPLLLIAAFLKAKQRRKKMEIHIHPAMLGRLYDPARRSLLALKHGLLLFSLAMMILSAAGLRIGSGLKELKQEGMDVIVALDLSASMTAEDISPSRLERSKYEVLRLINNLKGDRIGLVAFAGVSFLQCPITSDYRTATMMLEMMDTQLLPVQGTAFADAIYTAIDAFPDENQQYKAIILISDGEDHEQDIDAALQRAAEEKVLIYSLGVGTLKGSPIPVYDNAAKLVDYKRDSEGRVITTVLQENTLRQIAASGNGRYYRLGAVREPILSIYEHILHGDRQEYQTHEFARYRELYLIFAIFALFSLLLAVLLPETLKNKRKTENTAASK
ncbi:MAG: VWA domain-containing protein [Candidatus Neomarinimicrobiota bacterium]|jgi:Ca-activated chloride channel family protein|nr:VWA domain-containing protein [Candidatus Neomarinimicrobiota bacterium]MDD3965572.1 VWA domain-containing protein [Candidatus Neomarinimicrobiota bacterium]MDX9780420.1 VWA domain-containing protein [bacterium]